MVAADLIRVSVSRVEMASMAVGAVVEQVGLRVVVLVGLAGPDL